MNNSIKKVINMKRSPVICFLVIIAWIYQGNAQEILSVEKAEIMAIQNNRYLAAARLSYESDKVRIGGASFSESTQISAQIGQFNSRYFDHGIGLSQNIPLPKTYQVKRNYLTSVANVSGKILAVSENDVRKSIDLIYSKYHHLERKLRLIRQLDSLHQIVEQTARVKWEKGETDVLEKLSASQQKISTTSEMILLKAEIHTTTLLLNQILGIDSIAYIPEMDAIPQETSMVNHETSQIKNHPLIKSLEAKSASIKSSLDLKSAELLPTFNLGVNMNTIRGIGADNRQYNAGDRFVSGQIGMSIPLFRKGMKSDMKASSLELQANKATEIAAISLLQNELKTEISMYIEKNELLQFYIISGLEDVTKIRKTATNQYEAGAINYHEFSNIIQKAIDIEMKHIDLQREVAEHAINIYYLTLN